MERPPAAGAARRVPPVVRRAWPALVGVAVVVSLAVAALRVGDANLRAAEGDRLAAREWLVAGTSANVSTLMDPEQEMPQVRAFPFSPDGPAALNEAGLRPLGYSSAGFVALLAADGRTLASVPGGVAVDPVVLGPAWDGAWAGRATSTNAFRYGGVPFVGAVLPVGGDRPWGVIALGFPLAESSGQPFFESLGSMSGEPGGLVTVDREGVAVGSWNAADLGRPVLTPAEVLGLPVGTTTVLRRDHEGVDTTFVAIRVGPGFGFLFQQETARLVGDLRAAQHQRDLTLIGVMAAAVAALVLFQLRRELAARRDEARVRALLRNSHDLVLVVAAGGGPRFVSPSVERLLGHDADGLADGGWRRLCHPDDQARIRDLVADPASGPARDVRLVGADGRTHWFDVEASDLRRHPELGGVLLTAHEVGERKALQDELRHAARHDPLTGLPNRAVFDERLAGLLAGPGPRRPFALLYVDLDRFKPVNDSRGHAVGDRVLAAMADRIAAVAGPSGFAGRLGGDEFGVLLDGAGEAEAVAVAERLVAEVRRPVAAAGGEVRLDGSVGVALADPGGARHTPDQLLLVADRAMYEAKARGGGCVAVAAAPVTGSGAARPAGPEPELASDPGPAAPGGATPRPADPGPPPPRPPARHRGAALVPLIVAGAIVVAIAGAGQWQSVTAYRSAAGERVREREQATARIAAFYANQNSAERVGATAAAAPFTLDGSAVDRAVVKAFAENVLVGADGLAVLSTPDGRVLAASPADAAPALDRSGAVWRGAREGRPGWVPWVDDVDQPRSYYVLPILREGRTAAVLALGISVRHGASQKALERAGSVGYHTGGWSMLDRQGVVFSSWNPELIGQRVAGPDRLAEVPVGVGRRLERPGHVLIVAPLPGRTEPTYLALDSAEEEFFGDLQRGRDVRDLSLLALVLTAVAGLVAVHHRREQAVRRSERRLDALLQHAHDIVVVADDEDRVGFVSSGVHPLLGFAPADWAGAPLPDLVDASERRRVAGLVAAARAGGTAAAPDVRVLDARGRVRWFDLDAVDLRSQAEVGGVLITGHDVTERKVLQDDLARVAYRDPLTGLPNRQALAEWLGHLTADPSRSGAVAVLFVDLDHFKPVNDTLGHGVGDRVLQLLADRFRATVRAPGGGDGDDDDLVCRVGGDEFAVVLADATEASARAAAERLIRVAAEPVAVGGHVVEIGATVGVSLTSGAGAGVDTALRMADEAMYRAKEAGRGRYAVVTADGVAGEPDAAGVPGSPARPGWTTTT